MALSGRPDLECEFYDTHLSHESKADFYNFDYAVIASPIINHYLIYKHIRERFSGPILVEKPAVIYRGQFDILADPNVFVGVIERFNPVVNRLKGMLKQEKVISLEFTRVCERCRGEPYFELAIHDLDLMVYLLDLKPQTAFDLSFHSKGKIYTSQITAPSMPTCLFSWGENTANCRTINAVCHNKNIFIDLTEKTLATNVERECFLEDALKAEHDAFFAGDYPDTRLSHDLLLRLIQC